MFLKLTQHVHQYSKNGNIPRIIKYALTSSYTTYDTFITEIQKLISVIFKQNYF
jgi:hypothetical protein